MPAAQTTAGRAVGHVVAIADADDVGSRPAAGTDGTGVPGPAILGHKASAAGSEREELTIAKRDGRGIVDVGFAIQRRRLCSQRGNRRG